MSLKLPRAKQRNLLLSIAYRMAKLLPFGQKTNLRLLLDLQWIFGRLAHERAIAYPFNRDAKEDLYYIRDFLKPGTNVLDIGCGKGYIAQGIIDTGVNIVGVDYSRESIEIAKQKVQNPQALFICDDVFNYLKENPEKKFDYIILSHVLEHIDEPEKFLPLLKGIAKYLYIEVPDFDASHLNAYRAMIGTDLVYTDADHVSEFDRATLTQIIKQSGYKILESEYRFGVMKFWCEDVPA